MKFSEALAEFIELQRVQSDESRNKMPWHVTSADEYHHIRAREERMAELAEFMDNAVAQARLS